MEQDLSGLGPHVLKPWLGLVLMTLDLGAVNRCTLKAVLEERATSHRVKQQRDRHELHGKEASRSITQRQRSLRCCCCAAL
ncbi:hypothetical protein EYF80_050435 [Liparis tanakae]|uniref:Uncharacterized protein n=1 Tax=Liparis tanakae TaxID=230148 RepID=A0A4Z2FF91_9TELE|nr:hypothetical protein EYF80_050435 [Liparis tanakae]